MSRLDYPEEVRSLIGLLKRLPGIGPRSAERIVVWLMGPAREGGAGVAGELSECLARAERVLASCAECGFFKSIDLDCAVCSDATRDPSVLCVVEQATDVLPLERTGAFRGRYHCLGGRISPLDNVGPENLRIDALLERLEGGAVEEVILALGADVEGEATANYLGDVLVRLGGDRRVTRIAQGLPAGGGLESADELTLFRALSGRRDL